jgi:broad specificity phosphatase PhoE
VRISTVALFLGLGLASLVLAGPTARAADPATQTIVLLRHGEKPPAGLGQLDCQGLNRALALPPVLAERFGRPAAIFAPNPARKVEDEGGAFDYVRPLATIEPTAIALGMPVDASVGFTDTDGLQRRLGEPHLHNALVFVAWEHLRIVQIARSLLARHGGDADAAPAWRDDDFDSIYVVRIVRTGDRVRATFEHAHEGLNGQPRNCPG